MELVEADVKKLENLELNEDIPVLDSGSLSLSYVPDMDSNFEDSSAYTFGMNKFIEEANTIKQLNEIIEEGRKVHIPLLYTWRSITRTLPNVTEDCPNKTEIYDTCFRILAIEIERLYAFKNFVLNATETFITEIGKMARPERIKDGISDGILYSLGMVLDIVSLLDDLMGAKTSVKNDLSAFKRFASLSCSTSTLADASSLGDLSFFIASPGRIMHGLKDGLSKIKSSNDVIVNMVSLACEALDQQLYITPDEKHQFLRIMLSGLTLIGADKAALGRLEQKRKTPLSRIDKTIKDFHCIPLIGDMHANVSVILKKSLIPYEWTCFDPGTPARLASTVYNACDYIETFQSDHFKIICELSLLESSYKEKKAQNHEYLLSQPEAQEFYLLGLKAVKLMSKWNSTLQEIFAFKMSRPADKSLLQDMTEDVDEYALATKYNYKDEEKLACAKIIFFVKSLYRALKRLEDLITSSANMYIYTKFQELVHSYLKETLKKFEKSKKILLKTVLSGILEISLDIPSSSDDSKVKKGMKNYTLHNKSIPPLSTQAYIIRTMLKFLVTSKETRKELETPTTVAIHTFLFDTSYFRAMTNFSKTLSACAHMGNFWFREFYLEISAGKHIQFPIDMSFPWIIVDYLIGSNDPNALEYVLYPMDLYSDAATYSLDTLKRKHLFLEVEAEFLLGCEQLPFLLAEQLYKYSKGIAGSTYIDKYMKNEIIRRLAATDKSLMSETVVTYQPAQRFSNLCRQRTIQCLDRTVDLNHLLCQKLIVHFRKSINVAIALFENSSVEYIMEFKALLEITELTHKILSETFSLPPFQMLLGEVNNTVGSSVSRITAQIIVVLIQELVPCYSYCLPTNRFVRSFIQYCEVQKCEPIKFPMQHLFGSRSLNAAYADYFEPLTRYIGPCHFEAMFSLMGYEGLACLLVELKKCITTLMDTTLKSYVSVLNAGMPNKVTLPRATYGLTGTIEFFDANFESIMRYKDLKSGVLHHFREVGNCIVIVHAFEQAVYRMEGSRLFISSAQHGLFPLDSKTSTNLPFSGEKLKSVTNSLKHSMLACIDVSCIDQKFDKLVNIMSPLSQECLSCGLSFFDSFLDTIVQGVEDKVWKGTEHVSGITPLDDCSEFHRLFSVILYCMVHPFNFVGTKVDDDFGHGILFAGCAIVIALNQQHRFEAMDLVNHAIYVYDVDVCLGQPMLSPMFSQKSATLKSVKTLRANKSTLTSNESSLFGSLHREIVSNMKIVVDRRRQVFNILNNSFAHKDTATSEVIKCFAPPPYKRQRSQ